MHTTSAQVKGLHFRSQLLDRPDNDCSPIIAVEELINDRILKWRERGKGIKKFVSSC